MTAYPRILLRCDWPGCYARAEGYGSKVTDARKDAAKHGWKSISGLDLCGTREQAEKFTPDHNLVFLQGHAAREDHSPVVKPGAKGYVKLSCQCGWKVTAEYSWQPAGECPRTSIDIRWSNHVAEAELGAAGKESGADHA